jgi:hypothetical protein
MQKNKLPNIVSILILTLITVIMWVSFSVYRAVTDKPAPTITKTISEPLSPRLDTDTINKIESSVFLDSSQIPQGIVAAQTMIPIVTIPTPMPTPIVASASATPVAIP